MMPAWLSAVLALVPVVQGVAVGLKSIGSAWDPNYRVRVWYKFWNTVASFPGSAAPSVAAVPPTPSHTGSVSA
jgi:hypothetical protein